MTHNNKKAPLGKGGFKGGTGNGITEQLGSWRQLDSHPYLYLF